jgi:hypothetical protein
MNKKVALIVVGLVILAAVIGFISMRRARMMGGLENVKVGNLHAVTADGTPVPAPASAGQVPENTAVQESGGLVVSLAMNPYPPSGSKSTDFNVTLADLSGQPVPDTTISLDLTMPGMWMPPNQLNMVAGDAGNYQASGYFTMRGLWRIEVIITRGGQKQSVFFDVGL